MKIAIDARWIFDEMSGIGVYTFELIRHLGGLDNRNSYMLIFDKPALRDRVMRLAGLDERPHFLPVLVPFGVFSIRNQLCMPRHLGKWGADVYHSTNYMMPFAAFPRNRRGRTACVLTIHDVIPLVLRGHAPKSRKSRLFPIYRRVMVEAGKRANAIIAVSEASRKDIIKHLGIPAEREGRVRVIHNGVSEIFSPRGDKAGIGPDRTRNVLYVGRFDPYKNLPVLMRAFAEARKSAGMKMKLTVVGSPDPRYPEALRLAAELGLTGDIEWAGYLSGAELVRCYREADLLVHPSLYEGFGLQVAEAMRCGLPVICTKGGSLPEIAGDAAITVDAGDVSGMAGKMLEVLTRPELAARMSEMGVRRAAQFDWSKSASDTLALYEELGRN